MMKTLTAFWLILLSLSTFAARPQKMVCSDAEFGAGHLRVIMNDLSGFFYSPSSPREQRPIVGGEFWIKGEMFTGIFELPTFMGDWDANSGWYKSTPSPLEFSLCNWKKCPIRKIKLMVYSKDQMKGEGTIKFLFQSSVKDRVQIFSKLNCEIQ
jgi:hypothetical protein